MKRFYGHVSAIQPALQKRPKVLHAVRVDVALNVCFRMVDDLVSVILFQAPIRNQFIGKYFGTLADFFIYDRLKGFFATIFNDLRVDFSTTLKQPHNNGFASYTPSGDSLCSFAGVHVAGLAADEGFVNFYFATHLFEGT